MRKIPIYARTLGGVMTWCSLSMSSKLIAQDMTCRLKAAVYQHWDANKKMCVDDPSVQVVTGVGLSVSCPQGMKVAVADLIPSDPNKTVYDAQTLADAACSIVGPASVTPPPRSYSDGTTDNNPQNVASITLDIPNSTCKFNVPAGQSGSGYTNSIRCVSSP